MAGNRSCRRRRATRFMCCSLFGCQSVRIPLFDFLCSSSSSSSSSSSIPSPPATSLGQPSFIPGLTNGRCCDGSSRWATQGPHGKYCPVRFGALPLPFILLRPSSFIVAVLHHFLIFGRHFPFAAPLPLQPPKRGVKGREKEKVTRLPWCTDWRSSPSRGSRMRGHPPGPSVR